MSIYNASVAVLSEQLCKRRRSSEEAEALDKPPREYELSANGGGQREIWRARRTQKQHREQRAELEPCLWQEILVVALCWRECRRGALGDHRAERRLASCDVGFGCALDVGSCQRALLLARWP